ncbi:hypothetical protein BKA58DRAFT_444601 [Alternaria rosae]|uniref:uncharacterized protein n=1 Tax=Alternaria rosae TaxID=1187941 RepID=UPI001E8E9685|nr:uncharacterized protein BKA58DRAFT_444601 [Alternaria rosae]KAH6857463.1 hypothetical protein BKA58DRAFT_444601 [Alternaria rosae]
MYTSTILLIAAAATAAVAAPVTTIKTTNPTKTIAVAPASAGMVDTEGQCIHPPRDAAADIASVATAAARVAGGETQEEYNHKLVKMDKAREHVWRDYMMDGELDDGWWAI